VTALWDQGYGIGSKSLAKKSFAGRRGSEQSSYYLKKKVQKRRSGLKKEAMRGEEQRKEKNERVQG